MRIKTEQGVVLILKDDGRVFHDGTKNKRISSMALFAIIQIEIIVIVILNILEVI